MKNNILRFLLTLLTAAVLLTLPALAVSGGDAVTLDETNTVTISSTHAAKEGISSLQFSLKVVADEQNTVDFLFNVDTKVKGYRYRAEDGTLNVYLAGTKALFTNGSELEIGTVSVEDPFGSQAEAEISVQEDSLKYVYGSSMRAARTQAEPDGSSGGGSGSTGGSAGNAGNAGGTSVPDGNAGNAGDTTVPDGNSGNAGGTTVPDGDTGNAGDTTVPDGDAGNAGGTTVPSGNTGNVGGTTVPDGNTGNAGGTTVPDGNTGNVDGTAVPEGNSNSAAPQNTAAEVLSPAEESPKDKLRAAVDSAAPLQQEDYSRESYEQLEQAVAQAETVLNDPDTTSEQMESALMDVENALGALLPVQDQEQAQQPEETETVRTSTGIVPLLAASALLCAVTAVLIWLRVSGTASGGAHSGPRAGRSPVSGKGKRSL